MAAFIEIIKSFLYGIIEGITEWLPVSSTGHLILFEELFWKNTDPKFLEMFRVVIQLGAILAVICLYFRKLNPFSSKKDTIAKKATWEMWFKVIIACLPAAVIGLPFDDKLDAWFYNFPTVAAMLVLYGIIFVVIESTKRKEPRINDISEMKYSTALLIGIIQLLSLIPGTSRSGVTIIGALLLGCSRAVAAEFSFFLAIPVMFGASLLKCASYAKDLADGTAATFNTVQFFVLLVGMLVAFVVSMLAIKFLTDYVKKHNFKPFGYYRIIVGIILLGYYFVFMK